MSDKMMSGGMGMSPRKAMAGGASSGNFGAEPFPMAGRKTSPDAMGKLGTKGEMADGDRGIGMPIEHTKGHQPAQAAPRHGPMHEREMGFDRGGKV